MKQMFQLERGMIMRSKNPNHFTLLERYIDDYIEEYGRSPATREIAGGTGLSLSTVSRYLSQMRENGILSYDGHRNIQTRRQQMRSAGTSSVPVLGGVSCGIPKFAEGNIEEYIPLPDVLCGQGDFFILKASGDSMVGAGIDDGDMVLVRQQDYASAGQIVVALIDDEATLKRYYPEPKENRIRLHPENPELTDIFVPSCVIQGIAWMIFKKVQ